MLGALRRKVASGGSSSLVLGKSLLAIRSGVSVSRVSCNAGKEILLLQPRGIAHVRNFSHLVLPGMSFLACSQRLSCKSCAGLSLLEMLSVGPPKRYYVRQYVKRRK
ncbi:uncharacterized protein LOC111287315 isoform X3 [Durio zibethinus]|uniref:Uncharacterized protein LOC111287315 isoform X3 n=1 Tax=Durio zibethinus TaxID=66656 RepID=A0A6P5XZD5_DURZI|nr:uncharacterized protein LOC111287315 isoform X3 [Durio zibethinus]